jgi:nucleoid DNA-binding protein
MDKPISMSVKDYLIRTLAVKIMVSEKVIEAVVNHQFQSANEAMDIHNSLEISGFGKFYFNEKKAKKKILSLHGKKKMMESHLANPDATEQKKHAAKVTLEKTEALIKLLHRQVIDEE